MAIAMRKQQHITAEILDANVNSYLLLKGRNITSLTSLSIVVSVANSKIQQVIIFLLATAL